MNEPSTPRRGRGRPRRTNEQRRPATSQALDRGLRVFALVALETNVTLTELSATAAMAPSTLHRMLETLRAHDLVAFDERRQIWSIGVEAFRIGQSYARRANYLDAGRVVMRRLMEETGETANIAVIEAGDVVYVSQIETHAPIRAFFPPGTRGVPQASGIGKVLLACMDEKRRADCLRGAHVPAFTPNTITDAAQFVAECGRIRERGWAVDDEERHLGMRCIAAPIFDEHAEPIAGLSISAPTERLPNAELERQGPQVRAAADEVTDRIGGRAPKQPVDREPQSY